VGGVPRGSRDVGARREARRETVRLLLRKPGFVIGTAIVLVWVVCAVGGSSIAPFDPLTTNGRFAHAAPGADGWNYVLGTDRLGRDVLSRVIVGARDVLIVAPVSAIVGVVLGTFFGLLMGYYRGSWTTS
jgi:peptide/nickel transport system permease protein